MRAGRARDDMQPISTSIGQGADLDTLRRQLLQLIVKRETLRQIRASAAVVERAARDADLRPAVVERAD